MFTSHDLKTGTFHCQDPAGIEEDLKTRHSKTEMLKRQIHLVDIVIFQMKVKISAE